MKEYNEKEYQMFIIKIGLKIGYYRRLAPTGIIDSLNEKEQKIRQLEKSIERREEQISIIKKHCEAYLTEEQYKTIKEALSVT